MELKADVRLRSSIEEIGSGSVPIHRPSRARSWFSRDRAVPIFHTWHTWIWFFAGILVLIGRIACDELCELKFRPSSMGSDYRISKFVHQDIKKTSLMRKCCRGLERESVSYTASESELDFTGKSISARQIGDSVYVVHIDNAPNAHIRNRVVREYHSSIDSLIRAISIAVKLLPIQHLSRPCSRLIRHQLSVISNYFGDRLADVFYLGFKGHDSKRVVRSDIWDVEGQGCFNRVSDFKPWSVLDNQSCFGSIGGNLGCICSPSGSGKLAAIYEQTYNARYSENCSGSGGDTFSQASSLEFFLKIIPNSLKAFIHFVLGCVSLLAFFAMFISGLAVSLDFPGMFPGAVVFTVLALSVSSGSVI